MSLILQIQELALSSDCDIVQLLRRSHVAAVKLGLDETVDWLHHELDGYPLDVDIPEYRYIKPRVCMKDPFDRRIELVTEPDIPELPCLESASALAAGLTNSGSVFCMEFGGELKQQLIDRYNLKGSPYFEVSCVAVKKLLDRLQNNILNWALELEQRGVVGEKLSFSNEETILARGSMPAINYYVFNIYGDANGAQFQQGTNGSLQVD